jgi:hypothetical protein
MQLAIDISVPTIASLISQMNLHEIEELKNKIMERELYLKKFQKDDVSSIIEDFKKEDYSTDFLKDLENGLKKSSVCNDN